jgi:carbon-monoxide dehydrogenase medium subunit
MFAANFDYYRPTTVAEAVQLLGSKENAKILAGGHSLLPAMRYRLAQPGALIDIGRISELSGVRVDGNVLRIGAMTTHDAIANSADVKAHCAVLAEAAALIGDQMVRNRGTIGGALVHADPAADYPPNLLALGGSVKAMGKNGARTIDLNDFWTDLFTTALNDGEILTEIAVNTTPQGTGAAYADFQNPASGYIVVGASAVVTLSGGNVSKCSLVIGGATPNPVRAIAAEAALTGKTPAAANIAAAADAAAGAIGDPMSDVYASGDYRMHLAKVMAKRALTEAAKRAAA